MNVHHQIGIAMVIGVILGVIINELGISADGNLFLGFLNNLNTFIGELFLRGLRFVAVPIVVFSLIAGVGSLSEISKLGKIGGMTVAIYMATTAVAITVGLTLASWIAPGNSIPQENRDVLASGDISAQFAEKLEQAVQPDVWATLINIIPKNPAAALADGNMLQIVFFSIAVGIGLTALPETKSRPVLSLFETLTDVMIEMVRLLMRLAPLAVFCLLLSVSAQLGLDVLTVLGAYTSTVLLGLALLMFGLYPALSLIFAKVTPRRLYNGLAPAQLLAFSSSSSVATMPVTLECVEHRVGASREVTRFVIPLGATINMDGTALYQGVAAMFIAQMYGVDIGFSEMLTIVTTATLASIGTAGVPGVGLIMLVIVLQSIGIGPEAIAGGLTIIFGVDRFLDMCRTSCNVTGDAVVALIVSRFCSPSRARNEAHFSDSTVS